MIPKGDEFEEEAQRLFDEVRGSSHGWMPIEAGLLIAFARGRSHEAGRIAKLERERDSLLKRLRERPTAPHPIDQLGNLAREMWGDAEKEVDELKQERDEARRIAEAIAPTLRDALEKLRGTRAEAFAKCKAIVESYAKPNRFKVSDSWRDDMTPSEVYDTAIIDVSMWITEEIDKAAG